MGTRPAAALLVALIRAGCGAGADREAAVSTGETDTGTGQAEELLPAPPIEAIDEPAPKDALAMLAAGDKGWTNYVPLYGCEPEPCPEEIAAELRREHRNVAPAEEPDARAVARLRLDDGGAFYMVEYRSRGYGTCAVAYGEAEDGLPLGGTAGGDTCTEGPPERACLEVCILPVGGFGDRLILGGTVSTAGDSLRIAFEDGFVARYPLTGPTLPSDPGRRVFMVDQEHGMFTTVELLEGEAVVAEGGPSGLGDEAVLEDPLDQTPGTVVELDGTTLRVEIGPDAPREAQELLDATLVQFGCVGADDPEPPGDELPPASAEGRFPPGERSVDVELAATPAGKLILCAATLPSDQSDGVYRLYVTYDELDELFDGDVYGQETEANFELEGRSLTVTLGADAAPESELLLDRDLRFFCGTEDELGPYGASAQAEGRFPPGEREVTVTLSADPGPDVFFCGVEAKDGSAEAFSFEVGR